jgi:hypothetical protein
MDFPLSFNGAAGGKFAANRRIGLPITSGAAEANIDLTFREESFCNRTAPPKLRSIYQYPLNEHLRLGDKEHMRRFLSSTIFVLIVSTVGIVLYPDQVWASGELLLIGMITVVPTIALYAVPAYGLYRFRPQLGPIGSVAMAVAMILALGAAHNYYRDRETGRLTATNESEAVARLRGPFVLALQDSLEGRSTAPYCDDLCLRMLLKQNTSAYAKILVSGPEELSSLEKREIQALTIRKLSRCPGVPFAGNLTDNGAWYVSSDEIKSIWSVNPQFKMKRMEEAGACLAEEAVSFADVDTVIYVGRDGSKGGGWQSDWLLRPTTSRTIDIYQRNDGKLRRVFHMVSVFSDRLAIPPVVEPSTSLFHKFQLGLEAFRTGWRPGATMRSHGTRLKRQARNDADVPSIYSVVVKHLSMPLEFEREPKAEPTRKTLARPPENLSATFAKMVAQADDSGTHFSAPDIQEFMDGFRGVSSSALLPNFTIHRLLKNQPQSEITILKALLNSMRKEHRADPPQPAIAQSSLVAKLADALPLFSDAAIKASAAEFDALGMTPRQIGSMPDLAGALGILGKSRLPILNAIVEGYELRNLKAGSLGEDYFQYLSILQGLCAMGQDANGVLPRLRKMSERDQLLTSRDPTGASTLIMLLRLGASLDHYKPILKKSGWTADQVDAFAAETYVTADCMDLNRGRSILIRHPHIEAHWPFVTIKENITTKF